MQNPSSDTQSHWNSYIKDASSSAFQTPPLSSLFNALFHNSLQITQSHMALRFITLIGDIRNSVVFGPDNLRYFTVTTNASSPEFTVIMDGASSSVGTINWQTPVFVEILGVVPRQTTCQWLLLAPSRRFVIYMFCAICNSDFPCRRYRTMDMNGVRFFWVKQQNILSVSPAFRVPLIPAFEG
jgi:hypothetical protein